MLLLSGGELNKSRHVPLTLTLLWQVSQAVVSDHIGAVKSQFMALGG